MLQYQRQTRNHSQPGQRPKIRSARSLFYYYYYFILQEKCEKTTNSDLPLFSGFVVNGQIIGKKKVVPDGKINTYFGRLGIIHGKLGVRLEVSTQGISVFYDGKQVNLLWSDAVSIKETK